MIVSVFFTPNEAKEAELKNKIAVLIDVLRASTTLVVAVSNGSKQIIPVETVDKAYELKLILGEVKPILCGEREGKKLPNFDLGNSPFEYNEKVVSGKTLIYASTNGSPALKYIGKYAVETYIAGFINLPFVAKYLTERKGDVVVVCAGKENAFSFEDALCAGMLIDSLICKREFEPFGDQARVALLMYREFKKDILSAVKSSTHAQYLIGLGFENDINLACEVGLYKVLPSFDGKRVIGIQYGGS